MILLKAYAVVNFGDDLIVDTLAKRYPNKNFLLIAPMYYKKMHIGAGNIKIINERGFFCRLVNYIARLLNVNLSVSKIINLFCSGAVYAGGSLFIEPKIDNPNEFAEFCNLINKRFTAVVGCNFGPYRTNDFYLKYKEAFFKLKDICFRDKDSLNFFKDVPVSRYAPDIAFCHKGDVSAKTKKQVFISVIDFKIRDDLSEHAENYKKFIINLINHFIDMGYNVLLSSFCKYEGDEDMLSEFMECQEIKRTNLVKFCNYTGDIDKILTAMGESEYIVASRFHAFIAGVMLQKKVLPIVYSQKAISASKSYGLNAQLVYIHNLENINIQKIENLFFKCDDVKLSEIISNADGQFKMLDKFLKS